jgi:outer membrane autotransporter protein
MHQRHISWIALLPIGFALCLPNTGRAQKIVLPKNPTPNEKSFAAYMQTVCTQLEALGSASATGTAAPPGTTLTPGQQDLAARCLFFQNPNSSPAALTTGYQAILGQQINALGPQTFKFGSLQQDNLTSRLADIRRGATGASITGLTITRDDGSVLSNGNSRISDFLPGGASGDDNAAWLDGKLGVFVNGSLQLGSKRPSKNSDAFDIKDYSVTIGADYRIGQQFVVGVAVGQGKTNIDFASNLGRMDMTATGVSVYASYYSETFYLDALAGYGQPKLDTDRHIQYAETPGPGMVDQDAYGSTHLHDLWAGISTGRPFNWGAFAVTPQGSLNWHEIRLSEFSETMSDPNGPGSGLGLTFGNATVASEQARAGLLAAYTISTSWGVFEPHAHATWIREFRNHPIDFGAQFENAPSGDSAAAAALQTDPPETHYTAYGGGLNFQLAHAVAGYFDYEELRTLKTIKSHQFTLGIRYQVGM